MRREEEKNKMIALVTGASSGIGRDMARYLYKLGYDIVITARNKEKLEELKQELEKSHANSSGSNTQQKIEIILADLSKEEECKKLYEQTKEKVGNIDILINNAGFGLFGRFTQTSLETELNMIDTNIKAVHILTKLFLQDMLEKNAGHILNVSSIASFLPGPLMTTYYSTKSYVLRFSQSLREELKKQKSAVKISVLCPGPVDTNFNNVAKVKFNLPQASSEKVAKYGIDKMLKNKFLIMPGISVKCTRFFSKIVPDVLLAKVSYHMQKRKEGK